MDEAPVVWITGLPASGKTALARSLCKRLRELGLRAEALDGEELRKKLSPDLGFSKEDRRIHASRVTYISSLLARNGIIPIVAIISPYREFRATSRAEVSRFLEVYVKCSLETCKRRDKKGLYEMAEKGLLKNLSGVNDPYEEPLNADVIIDSESESAELGAEKIIAKLTDAGFLTKPKVASNRL